MKKLNVAIIGQGRSGRDIHGSYFKGEKNTLYNVVAVVDYDERRRNRALEEYPGCSVHTVHAELYGREDIDLVVNATFSNDHYQVTKDLLEHGFNVIVEKPFARSRYECDTLIKLAEDKGLVLAVFQQSFLAPYYIRAKELIENGTLGDIKQVDITFNGFGRRWDWQTTQVKMGGNIYNTGPHPIGFALGFLDFAEDYKIVYSKLDRCLNSGDSDDYAKIIMTAPGKPLIDVEVTSIDSFPAKHIKILGTKGTYQSTPSEYELKYIVDGENPPQALVLDPLQDENGYPIYCKEDLIKHEEKGEHSGTAFDIGKESFYEMVYKRIVNGTPLTVTPKHAAMVISVIEEVHAANPLPLIYTED